MAEYDLTRQMAPFLDRHLIVIPLLDFILSRNIYPKAEILQAKMLLLSKTHMVDYHAEVYKELNGEDAPPEIKDRRAEVVERLRKLQTEIKPFIEAFSNEEGVRRMEELKEQGQFKLSFLQEETGITEETLEAMYKYAKLQFECGNYPFTAEFLYFYRTLSEKQTYDVPAMWGKLAAEILESNWDGALEDLKILRDVLDEPNAPPQVQSRAWLIHWSLFVFFNHSDGKDLIIEWFFSDKNLATIQAVCPHILRYLTAAVILNKKKRQQIKDLVKLIEQERTTYRDPITEFAEALFVYHDFELAQEKLKKSEDVIANDYFLASLKDDFTENARLIIFENYCRIHSVIDIGMVADKLNMPRDKAEIWIVNLIRQARLDARIDSQANQVIMDSEATSVYQRVKEKTKNLAVRTYVLTDALLHKGLIGKPQK